MRNHRRVRWLVYPVLLFCLASGCQAFRVYRPVGVLVRDAETKQPIVAAEVHISYPLTRRSASPCSSSAASGQDGIARLRAAPSGDFGVLLEASAPGYAPEDLDVGAEGIKSLKPARLFEAVERRPADFVVEMYSEPGFTVELIVPDGYHGLVKAQVRIQQDAPRTPGLRCFRYEVSSLGVVQVVGSPLLDRAAPPDYRARYASGAPLGEETDPNKIGFRYLKREINDLYFVVGTRFEYDHYRRVLMPNRAGAKNRPEQDTGGGGRKGRHHG